tara:strand:- start:90199 stop:90564 length:366 start_codon:yes stop_codon:yes gene_type:complete
MQYGGVIRYNTNLPKIVLKCHYSVAEEISIATPEEASSEPVTEGEFEMVLDGNTTEYQQYSYLIAGDEDTEPLVSTTICYFENREVLRYHWEILMSAPDTPESESRKELGEESSTIANTPG